MEDQQFHKLYTEEFDDARINAAGAYRGNYNATSNHHEALTAAVEEAFNAGARVMMDHSGDYVP